MAYLCNSDILSLIFIDAFQNATSSLLTLRSVNRAWFYVAGSTPRLWTKLVLNRKSDFTNLEYAQFYLQRSGALPIDIHIALPGDVDVDEIGGVTALLRDQTSRFRSFELHVRIHEELEAFISSIGEGRPAPLLENLVLKVQRCTESRSIRSFLSLPAAFIPSPRLAHIELPGCPMPAAFPPCPHLSTLTSLTIDAMPFESGVGLRDIVEILDSSPALQHFVFKATDDFSYDTIGSLDYPHAISLPDLLTADVTAPGSGADLLRAINAPQLTDVRLDGFRADNFEGRWEGSLTEPVSATVRRLSVRSPNLRRLALEHTVFHSPLEDYALIFNSAGFTHLQELLLIGTDINDEALLTASGGPSSLKRATLRDCERVSGAGLLGFVRGRDSDFSLVLQDCINVTKRDIIALSATVEVDFQ
ncbi:hypothetical protein M413DRAFT_33135 [Hebeloma cylindrosporum]|uniref:F-box domain-containing protein n=1 Tax=Hebeloma cylindrosporum TaxID=76867 RepID=A0A0C2X9G3_HEBCY|nr:hypothetical protein M413DRAFT_33136 [Hebeloma cylindrosporum h7]KIM34648.1 hypothetical protein M413DRAFT_33135 [Hebeloma cylindrosporum h7]